MRVCAMCFFSDDAADEVARNMRVQSKLRTMDLSGCPVEGEYL